MRTSRTRCGNWRRGTDVANKYANIPNKEILCWTAKIDRDPVHMHLVTDLSCRRPLFSVMVQSEPEVDVGTAYNFRDAEEFTCTVAIDQAEWRRCMPAFQNGVAVYAGPFKIIGGLQ